METFHERLVRDATHKMVGSMHRIKIGVISKMHEHCLPCADIKTTHKSDEVSVVAFDLGDVQEKLTLKWQKKENGMYKLVEIE